MVQVREDGGSDRALAASTVKKPAKGGCPPGSSDQGARGGQLYFLGKKPFLKIFIVSNKNIRKF